MVCVLCLIPILSAFTAMIFTPAGFLWLDMTLLAAIGLFIYPVINLIVIIALDLTGKKAIGTAAGLIGLFATRRTAQAKGFGWMLDYFGEVWEKRKPGRWSLPRLSPAPWRPSSCWRLRGIKAQSVTSD